MNILDAIINAQGGAAVQQLGSQVGLGQAQTTAALGALVPALAAGFQRNMQGQGGLESLFAALASGNHAKYVDDPGALGHQQAITDGNGILGHVLGSKDVSRDVAARAAAQTGLSADVLKKLLPLAAAMMMGTFSKQSASSSSLPTGFGNAGGGLMSMLAPMLDQNRDGSIMDDVSSMLGRFMKQ